MEMQAYPRTVHIYGASLKKLLIFVGGDSFSVLLFGDGLVRIRQFPTIRHAVTIYAVARTALEKPIEGIKWLYSDD